MVRDNFAMRFNDKFEMRRKGGRDISIDFVRMWCVTRASLTMRSRWPRARQKRQTEYERDVP